MDPERRAELDFYLRIQYPILFASGRENSGEGKYQGLTEDIFTLQEFIAEGLFSIVDYNYLKQLVRIRTAVDVTIHNGNSEIQIKENQTLDITLDEDANEKFANVYYSKHLG